MCRILNNYTNITRVYNTHQEMINDYTGDTSALDDNALETLSMLAQAAYLAGGSEYYGENKPDDKIAKLRDFCSRSIGGEKDWNEMSEAELGREFLALKIL